MSFLEAFIWTSLVVNAPSGSTSFLVDDPEHEGWRLRELLLLGLLKINCWVGGVWRENDKIVSTGTSSSWDESEREEWCFLVLLFLGVLKIC